MTTLEVVCAMMDYNYTLHRRVWDSINTLTEEQFVQHVPYSHGSIRDHMVHLAATDTRWLRGLQGQPDARSFRLNPDDYPNRATTRSLCESVADEVMAYVNTLDEVAVQCRPQGLPMTVWQTLLHLANHGTDHRSQVLRALHDFGAPTFDQDLAFYFMGR
ncbi:MAG: DinB family protein [Chloroflexi bacterium]|nr:DinB family protein [Chloroflexota bacterium]